MSTVTVPMPKDLEDFIEGEVRAGEASSKAEVIRTALRFYKEEQFMKDLKEAEQEFKEGKFLTGDLEELLKNF